METRAGEDSQPTSPASPSSDVGSSSELFYGETQAERDAFARGYQKAMNESYSDSRQVRSRASMDIFHSLVHGMRVNVTPDMLPKDVAERLGMIHDAILLEMEERGVVEPLEPVEQPAETE